MKTIFGIDVGGTTVKIGAFDSEGTLLDKWEIKTDKTDSGSHIMRDIVEALNDYKKKHKIIEEDVIGYGFGIPGSVTGTIVNKCINLGWGVIDLKEEFNKYFPSDRVLFNNDANVAALGEIWKGNAQNIHYAVMFTLGTGVGGGVIVGGKILSGANGAGGEVGHMHVDDFFDFHCNCGNEGCLETVASATGIVNMAKYFIHEHRIPTALKDDDTLTSKKIMDYAKDGDELALKVLDCLGKYMGIATASTAGVVDPEVFIIGGGVSKAGDILIKSIQKYYHKYAFHPSKETKFVLAKLGNDAGIYGSAYMVKQAYEK